MLTRLFIRDFALIEKAEIEFGDGLNVITGETGAGKSILLGALYSILGGPTSGDLVREGAERCIVEGLMEFDERSDLIKQLQAIDIECEDGQLFLRREILSNGRSRAYVNGSGSPIKKLRQIGALLVDLHGQHEHQSLLDPHLHIHYLDAFGRLENKVQEVAQSWRAMRTDEQALSDLQERRQKLLVDGELRAFQLAEIRNLSPQPGEEEDLEAELQVLDNAHSLVQLGEEINDLLYQRDGSVYEQLSQVRRRFDRITEIDPSLLELPQQQPHLGTVAAGGGVFRVALDHAGEKRLSPRQVELGQAEQAQFHPGKRMARLDCKRLLEGLDGLICLAKLLMALTQVVPGAGVAGIEPGGCLKGLQRLVKPVFSMPREAKLVVHCVVFRSGGGGILEAGVRPVQFLLLQPGTPDGDPGQGGVIRVCGEVLGGADDAQHGVEQFRRQTIEPAGPSSGIQQ